MAARISQNPSFVRMSAMRFAELTEWLFGCAHRTTSFPRAAAPRAGAEGQQGSNLDTYVVCLECGRHLAYDWTAMRRKRIPWIRKRGTRAVQ